MLSGLGHGLDVMELLARERRALPLGEIAARLGLSKPGAHRLLATLRQRGFVDRMPGGIYGLGYKAWEVGCGVPGLQLARIAAPVMERLARRVGEGVILGAYAGGFDAVYLHLVESAQAVRVHAEIGARIAMHCTSTGLALLAHLPPERVDEILPRALPPVAEETITSHDELRRELQRVRARGYAINAGGWRDDVGGVAAPIFADDGVATAALCVAAPRYRMTRDWLRSVPPHLVAAAAEVSEALAPGTRRGLRRVAR